MAEEAAGEEEVVASPLGAAIIQRVAQLRNDRGWTVQQMADECGVSYGGYLKIERGERQMTTAWIERLAAGLGVTPSDLLTPPKNDATERPTSGALAYVRHVLKELQVSPSALALKAGIASSTLTRPLNNDAHEFLLSLTTLEKIKAASGVDYAPFLGASPETSDYEVAARAMFGVRTALLAIGFPKDEVLQVVALMAQNLPKTS